MSATKPVPDEVRDMVALVQVLSEMVEEALGHGTLLGLHLDEMPCVIEMVEDSAVGGDPLGASFYRAMDFCYGPIDPEGTMGDEEFAAAVDTREKPHNERVWAWRERLRAELGAAAVSS